MASPDREPTTSQLAESTTQLPLSEAHPPPPNNATTGATQQEVPEPHSDIEEDLLSRSTEDEVGKLLRATVEELETALQESRKLLTERDEELSKIRSELDRYRQQTVREIANKTKLAQALDESHKHAQEMEEMIQQWKMEVRETKIRGEQARTHLQREQGRISELERTLAETQEEKDKETEQLRAQLAEARQKISKKHSASSPVQMHSASESNPGPGGIDEMQLHFLKQAVYHLLTDFHAEDQLRAIVSILDFTAQERKAVYAKVQERKLRNSRSSGVFM